MALPRDVEFKAVSATDMDFPRDTTAVVPCPGAFAAIEKFV
jgi:hypothetical protein